MKESERTLHSRENIDRGRSYIDLNADVNTPGEEWEIQFSKDKEAARQYFLKVINPNTVYFHDLEEKLEYLFEDNYYDKDMFDQYDFDFVKNLYKRAYSYKFRFPTFVGAMKFYTQYAMKNHEENRYLERYEDRVTAVALYLAQGNEEMATKYLDEMMTSRMQPATPTFINAGKAHGGLPISCYLIDVQDNLESIGRAEISSMALSKMGGGVGINLTNIRASGDPIQKFHNKASGLIPFMKVLENTFSWIDQLGARPGSGAVYVSVHHPDVMSVLDSKRENADEKIRIKTLSIGLVVTDILFEAAKRGEDIYQFSPYDVEREYGKSMSQVSITDNYDDLINNPNIKKTKISARKLLQTIAELQFESGYPYLMFEDNANRQNNAPNVGRIAMSNLCSEILQPQVPSTFNKDFSYKQVGMDISCNLASINIARIMENGKNFGDTINTTVRALTSVSDKADIESVPSIDNGNKNSHAIGVGAMNLHGFLGKNFIKYGSFEALDFVNIYFSTVLFYAIQASNEIARERGETFYGFEGSRFNDGTFFEPFINARFDIQDEDLGGHDLFVKTQKVKDVLGKYDFSIPQRKDWEELKESVEKYGLYNRNLIAVAPTGSISMVNGSTMSIHPAAAPILARKEKILGRVYWPAPEMTNENKDYFQSAFNLGSTAVIETYNAAAPYVDQGLSLTLYFNADEATTKDLNKAYILAWNGSKTFHGRDTEDAECTWDANRRKRLGAVSKSVYYTRVQQKALIGTEVDNMSDIICESCQV